ncbi:MAG TPA: DUF3857 domain-containing protein, partial [Chryseosolibacter sp.]|nr:DUF3857 domain-containing protein [Chryseosolibacter sp.]
MTMKSYPEDTSAAAVILSNYGEAYVSINAVAPSMNFERHVRIKILKSEGVDWANASVLLYHEGADEEKLTNLKAVTYNLENGKIVESKMEKTAIFRDKFNRYFNRVKFTLPNVKVGSVLEYSYTIMSDFVTNFPDLKFQYDIPVRHSEFWAIIPDFFTYEKYMAGYVPVTDYTVKPVPA